MDSPPNWCRVRGRSVDVSIEGGDVGEGLVGQMMHFEIVPGNFYVVDLERILGQPLDRFRRPPGYGYGTVKSEN